MLGIGIIGCGRIAQWRHMPEYANNPNARLAGFYDLDFGRASEMAEKYGGTAYATVEALLADPAIDAVSVCTANIAHASISIAALEAGKHVLCEKPMATTPEDCEAMVAAARKTGKFLMIAHNQRLDKVHVTAKALVDRGVIGRILTFRASFAHSGPEFGAADPAWFFDRQRAAMGAMADLGVHKTDLIHYLTGQRVIRTTARVTTLDKRDSAGNLVGVDDNAFCVFELSGGAMGTMTASWTHYGPEENTVTLCGTGGILHLYEDPEYPLVVEQRSGERRCYDALAIWGDGDRGNSGVIDAWIDCLVHGRAPEISAESAVPAMRAVFASLESSATGRTVEIPENR